MKTATLVSILLILTVCPAEAEEYKIYKVVNGKLKLLATTKGTSARINGVKSGTAYTYAVKALVNGEWTTVKASDVVSVTAK